MTYMIMVCETEKAFRDRTGEKSKAAYWGAYASTPRRSRKPGP